MNLEERVKKIEEILEQVEERLNHVESEIKKLSSEMVTKREADKLWNVSWIMLGSIWTTLLILVINIIFGR